MGPGVLRACSRDRDLGAMTWTVFCLFRSLQQGPLSSWPLFALVMLQGHPLIRVCVVSLQLAGAQQLSPGWLSLTLLLLCFCSVPRMASAGGLLCAVWNPVVRAARLGSELSSREDESGQKVVPGRACCKAACRNWSVDENSLSSASPVFPQQGVLWSCRERRPLAGGGGQMRTVYVGVRMFQNRISAATLF